MPSVQSTDALSIIAFFLTLAGLLGTFFYIHLGDWYREVLALCVKWNINQDSQEREDILARRECRYEAEQTASWTTLMTSAVVTGFIFLIFLLSVALWVNEPNKTEAWKYIGIAGIAFFITYLVMTGFFIIAGYRKARDVRAQAIVEFPPVG